MSASTVVLDAVVAVAVEVMVMMILGTSIVLAAARTGIASITPRMHRKVRPNSGLDTTRGADCTLGIIIARSVGLVGLAGNAIVHARLPQSTEHIAESKSAVAAHASARIECPPDVAPRPSVVALGFIRCLAFKQIAKPST